ncbi:MAG: helix-turn-helix domain-containing protein [Oscillospiraceae bacterium]|jgi:transcriptional regulator with XRE-family HTH domain|nr:helix-turn-helix domain-containing protein [Oscillospiraceae bacterium]
MDYRERLKNERIDHDLLQADVAKICGVSDATVGHWETYRRHMQVEDIVKLCKYYKISADTILEIKEATK